MGDGHSPHSAILSDESSGGDLETNSGDRETSSGDLETNGDLANSDVTWLNVAGP